MSVRHITLVDHTAQFHISWAAHFSSATTSLHTVTRLLDRLTPTARHGIQHQGREDDASAGLDTARAAGGL